MRILRHPDEAAHAMAEAFVAEGLIYGAGDTYPSLLTPSSGLLRREEAADVEGDLALLWGLYRTWHALYLASLAGAEPPWIAALCEQGLSPAEVEAQRVTARAGLEPRLGRVDYVALGARRAVAEIQWKSGGLGLFFGTHDVCAAVEPGAAAPLGDPTAGLRELIARCGAGGEPVAANGVRSVWFRGEHYLRRAYDRRGLRYLVFDRREAARRLVERRGRFQIAEGPTLIPVDFLYAQELLPALPPETVVRLARAAAAGSLWVETPLSYIYRQKWGLALPFLPAYRDMFGAELRAILGPTALLQEPWLDLSALAEGLPEPEAARLRAARTLDDLAELPTAARRRLVLKCGGGVGAYYSQGRGVLRVTGSRAAARKVTDFVRGRLAQGEPWIAQRYVDVTYPVDLCPPWDLGARCRVDAHARLMVFGAGGGDGQPRVIGGLANFGAAWKVSGRAAGVAPDGRLVGTAFTDLRVG